MKVFVYEHLCGGPMAGGNVPSGELAGQGAAMLSAVVHDFLRAKVDVVTSCDKRMAVALDGAVVTAVSEHDDYGRVFDSLAAGCDAALVIAPEFDGLLQRFACRLQALNVRTLGCRPEAIALCADKLALAEHLALHNVPTPATVPYHADGVHRDPVIIKPRFGAGCEDTFYGDWLLFSASSGKNEPVPHAAKMSQSHWVVQPFVEGMAASASLLVHEERITPLAAGCQNIMQQEGRLHYVGGRLPLDGVQSERAMAMAVAAGSAIAGLNGFVGVDMVLADHCEDDVVIEINPRLTVSYIGLQKICKSNLAAALLSGQSDITCNGHTVAFDATGRIL